MGFFEWLWRCKSPSAGSPGRSVVDPQAMSAVERIMREAWELPIGSVRDQTVAHLKLDRQGCCFLNGKQVTIDGVKVECTRLSQLGGVVLFYREDAATELVPEAKALLNLITMARLPLTIAVRDYDSRVKVTEYTRAKGSY